MNRYCVVFLCFSFTVIWAKDSAIVWNDTLIQWNTKKDVPILGSKNVSPFKQRNSHSLGLINQKENSPYRLDYGGNKSLLVSVGENQSVQLEQALQLDVEGQLSENMWIRGHLSDQNIPIQPEGNTATLQEVDQIFLELYGKQYGITIGDFLLHFGKPSIDRFVDNVQGIQGWYQWNEYKTSQSLVRNRGQFHAYTFSGEFGKQSNYFLKGKDGQEFITVLAGTEKVWKDGEELKRGVDYQIEYGEGRIDFLSRELVTEKEQYTVEFQYTERDYGSLIWAGVLEDTLGSWTWNVRGVVENNSLTPLTGVEFSEEDLSILRTLTDSTDKVRTSGVGVLYDGTEWTEGLYTRVQVDSPWVWVSQQEFEEHQIAQIVDREMYLVSFSLQGGGNYKKVSESQFVYEVGGGYAPGVVLSLPMRQAHYAVESKWKPELEKNWGTHTSDIRGFISEWDPNLYSSLQEEDNYGYGIQYNLQHIWGTPWNTGGVGQWDIRGDLLHKSAYYKSFRQVENPYFYRENWNISGTAAENNVTTYELGVKHIPWSHWTLGGEWGQFKGKDVKSNRWKGTSTVGDSLRFVKGYVEEARTKHTIEASGGRFAQGLEFFLLGQSGVLTGEYDRIEFVETKETSPSSFGQGIEQEAVVGYASNWYPMFREKLKTTTNGKWSLNQSNFLGTSTDLKDSLILLEGSQGIEWKKVGVWNGELVATLQDVRLKATPNSEFQRQSYQLLEWTNLFRDNKRGYYFTSTYRIHPKVEVPLKKQFIRVAEGTGDYLCVGNFAIGENVSEENCVLAGEKGGSYQLEGFVRDTIRYRSQDLSWVGNIHYTPKNMPWKEWLFLEQWNVSLHFEFIKQDSSNKKGWIPPFTNRDILSSAAGKKSWQPSLQWRSPHGNKTFFVLYEDVLEKSLSLSREEYSKREKSRYEWDVNGTWSLGIQQFWQRRNTEFVAQENTNTVNNTILNRSSLRWGGGSSITYRFWQWYRTLFHFDYSRQSGLEGTESFRLQDVYPRVRLEKDWRRKKSTIGKVYGEYGWYYRWGSSLESIYLNDVHGTDFGKGKTHRVQLGMDIKLGNHIYCTGNYIARLEPSVLSNEPNSRSLFQKMTVEIQAVF